MASRLSTFQYTPKSRKCFNSCSRSWRTSCYGSSLLVTPSMHKTRWSFSLTSANVARFSRLRQARPLMIHLHNSLGPDLSFPRQFWNSPIFQVIQFSDSVHHDALQILTFATSSKSSNFYCTRRDVLYFVTLDVFRYTSAVLHRRCISAGHLVTLFSYLHLSRLRTPGSRQ